MGLTQPSPGALHTRWQGSLAFGKVGPSPKLRRKPAAGTVLQGDALQVLCGVSSEYCGPRSIMLTGRAGQPAPSRSTCRADRPPATDGSPEAKGRLSGALRWRA